MKWRKSRNKKSSHKIKSRKLGIELLEDRVLLATVTVNSTTDTSDGVTTSIAGLMASPGVDNVISLREAITAANNTPNVGGPDEIHFNIPANDLRHVYYVDDGTPGTLARFDLGGVTILGTTTEANDVDIPTSGPTAIDPDWMHSWYSIQISSALPSITEAVVIDGYTQTGASANSNPISMNANTLLRIELIGVTGNEFNGLQIDGGNSTVRGMSIHGFGFLQQTHGIELASANNTVEGSHLGADVSGLHGLGNQGAGVFVNNSASNLIGGTDAAARNHIAANRNGVAIDGVGATGNMVQGSFITNHPNFAGVLIASGASNNTVGGDVAEAANVIGGNQQVGVQITGMGSPDSSDNNHIEGNFIGTNPAGSEILPNNTNVLINFNANNNVVGGLTDTPGTGRGNVISGGLYGVFIFDATDTLVQGNVIGTNPGATAALPNYYTGVLDGGFGTVIGGDDERARNVISGNFSRAGIDLQGSGALVQNNFIGTDITGTADLGNGGGGISVLGYDNTIVNNVIAFNELFDDGESDPYGAGVLVRAGEGNTILMNSIFANEGLGIELVDNDIPDGVPASNDAGDPDPGPNNLQNFPVLNSATTNGTTVIEGTLNSLAETSFRIEFFANNSLDPSGHGEGQTFLGYIDETTDASGNTLPLMFISPIVLASGQFVTATATRLSSDDTQYVGGDMAIETSEFSEGIEVLATQYDFGDAPEDITVGGVPRSYPTFLDSNGARHEIVDGGPFLGAIVPDAETDGQPNANATGDDALGDDDEDVNGASAITLIAGQPLTGLELDHNGGPDGAFLSAWIDLNIDGDWNDPGEQFLVDVAVPAGASSTPLDGVTIPLDATDGTSYVRVRISTEADLAPTGLALDGEVEDFQVTIQQGEIELGRCGFMDANPDSVCIAIGLSVSPADGTVFDFVSPELGNFSMIGELIPPAAIAASPRKFTNLAPGSYTVTQLAELGFFPVGFGPIACDGSGNNSSGIPTWTSTFNPSSITLDTQAGAFVTCDFVSNRHVLTVKKVGLPADGTDFDFTSPTLGNFTLDDGTDGDAVVDTQTFFVGTDAPIAVTELVPPGWALQDIQCAINTPPPVGQDPDGSSLTEFSVDVANGQLSVNFMDWDSRELACTFINAQLTTVDFDFGDAPDSTGGAAGGNPYPTLLEHNGARHVITEGPFLGMVPPDAEADGSPSANADGDDNNNEVDDEDGVVISDGFTLMIGAMATATVHVSGTSETGARLFAWIDFDGNGSFDPDEQISDGSTLLTYGDHEITFTVPDAGFTGMTYARFRLTTDTSLQPDGQASDGEVEDYKVTIEGQPAGPPDLIATKTNNVNGATTLGNSWTWTVTVANTGAGPATFSNGQTIFSDNFPNSNISYGSASVANVVNVTGSANLSCNIVGGDLTCTASGGPVTLGASTANVSPFTLVATGPGTAQLFGLTSDSQGRVYVGNNSNSTTGIPVQVFDPALFTGTPVALQNFGPAVGDADGLAFGNGFIYVGDRDEGLRSIAVPGAGNSVLVAGAAINPTGSPIVYRPSDGHLFVGFGASVPGAPGDNRIDEYDALGEFVQTFTTVNEVETMTFDPTSGLIYYASYDTEVRAINPLTGLDVHVGNSSGFIDGGLAFDPLSGLLFVGTANGLNSGLVETIDPTTGVTKPFASGFDGSLGILREPVTGDLYFLESNRLFRLNSNQIFPGSFDVQITATPSVAGNFTNPRNGGSASVDPNNSVSESNERNNSASDSVTVTTVLQDFGDAPEIYHTLLASNGARHVITDGPFLGTVPPDAEADGSPSANADGDDNNNEDDDEDGVMFSDGGTLMIGEMATATVHVSGTRESGARLFAWIDFDGNGSFDTDEQISDGSTLLMYGDHEITFTVPDAGFAGMTYARFRLTTDESLQPYGPANDGEVEDYKVTIEGLPACSVGGPLGIFGEPLKLGHNVLSVCNATPSGIVYVIRGTMPGDAAVSVQGIGVTTAFADPSVFAFAAVGPDGVAHFAVNNSTDDVFQFQPFEFSPNPAHGSVFVFEVNVPPADPNIPDATITGSEMHMVTVPDTDTDGDPVTATAMLHEPDANAQTAFGLDQAWLFFATADMEAHDYYYNYFGWGEKYVWSAWGWAFLIVPNGDLYAWGWPWPVASLGSAYHTDPSLLTEAVDPNLLAGADDVIVDVTNNKITVTPQNGFTGTAIVWVTLTDGCYTVEDVYRVKVTPEADPLLARSASRETSESELFRVRLPSTTRPAQHVTAATLSETVRAALDLYENTGLTASQLETFSQVEFAIADLDGARLGETSGQHIVIDIDAAGHGWYIDDTPLDNEEFTQLTSQGLQAAGDSAAAGHMDLLTVVLHELGHVLGHDDHFSEFDADDLMYGSLAAGLRRL